MDRKGWIVESASNPTSVEDPQQLIRSLWIDALSERFHNLCIG
jgi:hypothetical protein